MKINLFPLHSIYYSYHGFFSDYFWETKIRYQAGLLCQE
jgi:hypothetical protein